MSDPRDQRQAETYDLEYAWKTDDIAYWLSVAGDFASPDGPILELACGTLRLTLAIAQAGFRITGLDLSPHMLAIGQRKLEVAPTQVQERVALAEGDMRNFDLGQKFKLVFVPFNSFLLNLTVEDQLATLLCARKHLDLDGVLGLDLFVPDLPRLGQDTLQWTREVDQEGGGGRRLQRDFVRTVDRLQQVIHVTFRMSEYRDGVLERQWLKPLSLTYIFHRELLHLLDRAGLVVRHLWADYARTDLYSTPSPQQQLVIASTR